MELHNDTAVNVAALLKELVGAVRFYPLTLESLPLGEGLVAERITGSVRLTRLTSDIMARVRASGDVELECQRCLSMYKQPFEVQFDEQFKAKVDVRTGVEIGSAVDEERFEIDENHELDFSEPLRQEILVSLPMRPVCGDNCPGPPPIVNEDDDDEGDIRFAALKQLLDDE